MNLDFLTKPEKIALLKALVQDPEIQTEAREWFDRMLLTSELRPVQRLAKLEEVTGIEEPEDEDEPTIPQQISLINERINSIEENGVSQKPAEPIILPSEGVADNRAIILAQEALKAKEEGVTFFGSGKINAILRNVVPEKFRVKNGQNIGQAKKEAFAKLETLFPGTFRLDKKQFGRHEIRLVFS